MGLVILIVLAGLIAGGAGDAEPLWAAPLAVFSLFFVPAIYASVKPIDRRQLVLRVVVVGALVLALAGAPVYGLELPIILAPAIGLIAQAAGFIFQGPAQRGSR
jgi:hypothetical protein